MTALLESYEQQYSTLTAEIVAKTGRIPNLSGSEKQNVTQSVEKLMDEAGELLEQMELEVRGIHGRDRQKHQAHINSYKAEITKLDKDLRRARIAFSDEVHAREELLGPDDSHQSEDQRSRLLDNSERVERSGRRLDQSYKTCIETEEIGAGVLEDLHHQRSIIQKSRDRLRETNEALGKSSRVLSGMAKRIIQNRVLLIGLSLTLAVVIGIGIYFATRKQ